MTTPVLEARQLIKRFGGLVATDNLSMTVNPGELHAVIGPNGAGKTTLIGQLTGAIRPDGGDIFLHGRRITHLPTFRRSRLGLARSFQITSVFSEMTVLENVALAVQAHSGHSFRFWKPALRDPALREAAEQSLDFIGLAPRRDDQVGNLSHGEQRQLEMAMALATKPRILLLDEPMAGMSQEETARMVAILGPLKKSVPILLIEHDMDAVFALADRISVLVYGRIIASGSPDAIRINPEVKAAYLGDDDA